MTLPSPLISASPDCLGGEPCFTGTRVPVRTLIDYVECGHPVLRALLIFLAAVAVTSSASAQEVFGTLRRSDVDIPSQGTVVVAERLSDGQTIARAVTGERGTWRLHITTDRLIIRALRIGFEPHVLDTLQLTVGERRELNAILPGTSAVLPTVRTAADSRCRVRPDSASLVARIFHDARTALAASQLVSPDGPVLTRVRVSNETWAPDETNILEASNREYFSDSLRPFRTVSVDSLLEFGFVTRQRERFAGVRRAVDVAVAYRVPSVDLIVDDRFLADYCLHLADARQDHPDWIGVGFRPARHRRITQIQGTLWIDRHTAELRRLEFGYAGLEGIEARINSGGWLEFTRLETGLWFVNRWALRAPSLRASVENSARGTVRTILREVPVIRVSGEVLDLAVDSRAVFTAGATDFLEAGDLVPIPIPVDSTQQVCESTRDQAFVFGTVRSASGAVLPAADLRFFWPDPKGEKDSWLQSNSTTQQAGQFRVCELPQDRLVTVEVRADGHEPAAITLRIGSPRTAARLDLVLVPTASD